jgi:hypothetical protein
MSEPLLPYLLDIATAPESDNLILAGGLGLRLKQQFLRTSEEKWLIEGFEDIRATQDMDFFLLMSMFLEQRKGAAFRDFLRREGYEPVENAKYFHFAKQVGKMEVKIDLLARLPSEDEKVKVSGPRVGSGSGIELHGRVTPEAFSLEDSPFRLPLQGKKSNGEAVKTSVFLPHACTWLNLKVQAAFDWVKNDKPGGRKHVKDVYALTAMLTESELEKSVELAAKYREVREAAKVRQAYQELFGSASSSGCRELKGQGVNIDPAFFEGLQAALGI